MPRPTLHAPDLLLDEALRIAVRSPGRLRMADVARGAGAPSGSVYHRFPTRSSLLGALWVRGVSRFQAGFLEALGDDDPLEARVGAARHVVRWSRAHSDAATALLQGPAAFDFAGWPKKVAEQAERHERKLERALDELAARTPGGRARNRESLTFVTVDVPYAVVRRHLRAGTVIPPSAEELVEQSARTFAGTERLDYAILSGMNRQPSTPVPDRQRQRLTSAAEEACAAEQRGDDAAAGEAWRRYRLIGDTLRDPDELLAEGIALSDMALRLSRLG